MSFRETLASYQKVRAAIVVQFAIVLLTGCAHVGRHATVAATGTGKSRFETYCAGCHLNEGPFMRGEAPPLEGSSWIAGPDDRAIRIVLHGLRGKIDVAGKTYNQEMPAFGPVLSDSDIASLLSYARGRFGGAAPVSVEAVAAIRTANRERAEYWTAEDLLKQP